MTGNSITYTKSFTVTPTPVMILGKDYNRKELDIYNMSINDYIYIGLGEENVTFTKDDMIPLAPGEAYGSTVPTVTAVYLASDEPTVRAVISYGSSSHAYVNGAIYG